MHAEVQAFIEALAETILTVSEDASRQRNAVTLASHHLLVWSSWSPLTDKRRAGQARYPPFLVAHVMQAVASDPDVVTEALSRHRRVVQQNNGIKAGNVRTLLLPLGYQEQCFEAGLLDRLDAFGRARGEVAHSTGMIAITSWPSGSTELKRVEDLFSGLEKLDQYVARLLVPL